MKQIITTLIFFGFSFIGVGQNVGVGETNPTASKLQVKTADSAVLLIQNTATALNTKTGLFYKSDNNFSGSIATIQTAPSFYRMGLFTYGSANPNGLKERVSILDGGNVGIGTTNPTAKLEVAGNIKIADGTEGADKVLTSDAAGNATWQKPANAAGAVGFGAWGDCSTNSISEYNPVTDSTGNLNLNFGSDVAILGNYAVIGASYDNNAKGVVSIFTFNGSNWESLQKLSDPTGVADELFGTSVAISSNYVVVGSVWDDVGGNNQQGSACIFKLVAGNWVFMQKITDVSGSANDNFGISVAISGNNIIVGSRNGNGANLDQGSAIIFKFNGTTWVQSQNITDATGATGDSFGESVSISGNYAIVGATFDDVGANTNQGSASIYFYNGTSWVLSQKFTDAAGAANDYFGQTVSISGNAALVGAYGAAVAANADQGNVSAYSFNGTNWVFTQKLIDALGSANDRFGVSVNISGNYAIVGAKSDDINNSNTFNDEGSTTIFLRVGQLWQKVQKFTDPGAIPVSYFGEKVFIDAVTKRFLVAQPILSKVTFGKVN